MAKNKKKDGEVKFSWNTLYKVCNGLRNFGNLKANAVGDFTGTDPLIWRDPSKWKTRERFRAMIEDGPFGAGKPRVENPKKRGRKPKVTKP